jgi:uncharacterized protein (TIGR02246 family)
MRAIWLALFLALAAPLAATAAPARLTEADIRVFLDRQSRAWNAGDLAAWAALYTPDAVFTDQARAKDGRVVPYGTSSLKQALAQARRQRASATVRETSTIRTIRIAPDGRTAAVSALEQGVIIILARTRRLCAENAQTVVLTPRGIRSRGDTDTYVACGAPPAASRGR